MLPMLAKKKNVPNYARSFCISTRLNWKYIYCKKQIHFSCIRLILDHEIYLSVVFKIAQQKLSLVSAAVRATTFVSLYSEEQ